MGYNRVKEVRSLNTINLDVYKNTLKRTDGFPPVSGENEYTRLVLHFKPGDDWDNCEAVTLCYYTGSPEIGSKLIYS